jgi:hypothetical protein
MFLSFAKWGGGAHDASWRTMAQAETAQRAGPFSGSAGLRASRTGDSMESSRQEIVPEPILAFKTSYLVLKNRFESDSKFHFKIFLTRQ